MTPCASQTTRDSTDGGAVQGTKARFSIVTSGRPLGNQLNAGSRPEQRRHPRLGDGNGRGCERKSEGGVNTRATRGARVPLRKAVEEVVLESRPVEHRLDEPDRLHLGVEVADPRDPEARPLDERRQ